MLTLEDQYNIKELELNALLEVTQAINSNLPENALYKIFGFTLRANLDINKVILFVKDTEWNVKVNYGIDQVPAIDYTWMEKISRPTYLEDMGNELAEYFDLIVPIRHKSRLLAFLLVGQTSVQKSLNINFIQALSNIIVVAIENKKLVRAQIAEQAFHKEIEIAKRVQELLFPNNLPWNEHLKVQATYLPHHDVGGDYYDFIPINDDEFFACIADVSGKGVPAALLMSNFQATLRTLSRKITDLVEIVTELNWQLIQSSNGENFITFFLAHYNARTAELSYVSAGHNTLLLKTPDTLIELESNTTLLGVFPQLPVFDIQKISSLEKFSMIFYTDGITEAMNEKQEEYGFEALKNIVKSTKDLDMHKEVLFQVRQWQGSANQHDDITLMTIHHKPA